MSSLHPQLPRKLILITALAVLLLLAGCSADESDRALPSGDEAAEEFSSVGVYNATLVYETEIDNETVVNRIERTVRPTTGERYQVTITDGNRTITVSNGTTTWVYRPASNQVSVTSINSSVSNQSEQIRELFERVNAETDTEQQSIPILTLFPVAQDSGEDSVTSSELWSDPVTVSYDGIETVAGRDAFVIKTESVEDADRQMKQTMYVDTEHYVILQGEWEMEVQTGDTVEYVNGSVTIKSVEFDPDVDDDIFEFEVPENATVSNVVENITSYESYEEIAAESDRPVPDPDVPDDFEFETGSDTTNAVSLTYSNGGTTIFVSRRTTGEIQEDGEQISRNGRTYRYSEQFGSSLVQWTCGDVIYSVGGQLSKETLLDIADSVQCVPPEG